MQFIPVKSQQFPHRDLTKQIKSRLRSKFYCTGVNFIEFPTCLDFSHGGHISKKCNGSGAYRHTEASFINLWHTQMHQAVIPIMRRILTPDYHHGCVWHSSANSHFTFPDERVLVFIFYQYFMRECRRIRIRKYTWVNLVGTARPSISLGILYPSCCLFCLLLELSCSQSWDSKEKQLSSEFWCMRWLEH